MTRADLVRELSWQCGLSTRQARKALNAILSTMVEAFQVEGNVFQRVEQLDNGHYYLVPISGITLRRNAIEIRGFGRLVSEARRTPPFFSVIYQRRTPSRWTVQVKFRPSRHLREVVSGEPDSSHYTKSGTPRRRLLGQSRGAHGERTIAYSTAFSGKVLMPS